MTLPTDAAARKLIPLATGCLDYFPNALAAVAELSAIGNEQHNPGQPLHWDRSKSGDEADALMRHLMQRGTVDTDGVRHSAKVAWRALALLQKEIEAALVHVDESDFVAVGTAGRITGIRVRQDTGD
ncbi:dATP/dGTP diphosphohydrolase domain-containing protein [Pseudoxanthomonas kalamensis]|uniref:dATP/dGTP diphosphohydrolase domain-containing protein n=1 Tax=Pseudoxanthomonas kalamensis TaxID=289483 RepID=UPI001390C915|nr:dATP/dGTP diphosphohydrolase domain-containing protein [Pseudoxanthomonas kalamensis]